MSTISNKEAALLGLLTSGPMHAYEIEKEIYNRSMRDWTEISMSSIYKVLARLEDRKLVVSEVKVSDSNRIQKKFTVTDDGRKVMHQWVTTKASAWERTVWPIDIAISNLDLLSTEEKIAAFGSYIRSVDESIACYNDLLGYLKEHCSFHSLSLALRPLKLLEAERSWATDMLNHYTNHPAS